VLRRVPSHSNRTLNPVTALLDHRDEGCEVIINGGNCRRGVTSRKASVFSTIAVRDSHRLRNSHQYNNQWRAQNVRESVRKLLSVFCVVRRQKLGNPHEEAARNEPHASWSRQRLERQFRILRLSQRCSPTESVKEIPTCLSQFIAKPVIIIRS